MAQTIFRHPDFGRASSLEPLIQGRECREASWKAALPRRFQPFPNYRYNLHFAFCNSHFAICISPWCFSGYWGLVLGTYQRTASEFRIDAASLSPYNDTPSNPRVI